MVTAAFVAVGGSNKPAPQLAQVDPNTSPSAHSPGFYFYKTAIPARNGSTDEAYAFMTNYSGGFDCSKVNLGCTGYKISCEFGDGDDAFGDDMDWDRQLHYVHAPLLFDQAKDGDDLGVDGWSDFMEASFGDMSAFTPFMHNKLQLFVADVDAKATQLEQGGYDVMKRLSAYGETGMYVAHVSVHVLGYVWEFVGSAPASCSSGYTEGCAYKPWTSDECPAAHEINVNMTMLLSTLEDKADHLAINHNSSFWIATHVATSSMTSTGMSQIFEDLESWTDAHISRKDTSDCSVVTVSFNNMDMLESGGTVGDQVVLKYVKNDAQQSATANDRTLSVSDYEEYITKTHERYLTREIGERPLDKWRNWDHWLDMHVGVKFKEVEGCEATSTTISQGLINQDALVGKRAINNDGDHYYIGYRDSSMCVEYNTEQCHDGVGETNICTCIRENSKRLAFDKLGNLTDDGYGCDHDDVY